MNFRVGMGYDVHRLANGRPCVIGGITFDCDKGPLGHSDGDVLLHAVCDALLGAVSLGDLGDHFPDSDARWRGADSQALVKHCVELVHGKGWQVNNLDAVIVCERPKIKTRRDDIRRVLGELLLVSADAVSVKATTEEGMGFTGSGDGIAAWAYISLVRGTRL